MMNIAVYEMVRWVQMQVFNRSAPDVIAQKISIDSPLLPILLRSQTPTLILAMNHCASRPPELKAAVTDVTIHLGELQTDSHPPNAAHLSHGREET